MKTFKRDKLVVEIFENRIAMGEQAAKDVASKIKELLSIKSEVNIGTTDKNNIIAILDFFIF